MAGKTQGPPPRGSRTPSSRRPSATASSSAKKPTSSGSKPPAKKPNFAARRIFALMLVAAVAALVVWGGIWLFGFIKDTISDRVAPDTTQSEEPTDGPFLDQPAACEPSVTEWKFAVDGSEVGSRVNIPYTVTNNGEIPCVINGGASSLVLTVTSGEDRIWSNADCSSDELKLLLGAGDSTERTLTWNGDRSVPGCTTVDAAPEPGTYTLEVAYNGTEIPGSAQAFTLR